MRQEISSAEDGAAQLQQRPTLQAEQESGWIWSAARLAR
jgi:hypothetical protein